MEGSTTISNTLLEGATDADRGDDSLRLEGLTTGCRAYDEPALNSQHPSIPQFQSDIFRILRIDAVATARIQTEAADQRALDALLSVLPRSAEAKVPSMGARVDLIIGGHPVEVKWVGDGSLGEVRRRIASWRAHPDVVVGRRLSPGAREFLSEAGIGWVDETGAAEIALGSIIVSRTGRPPEKMDRPAHWTPAVLGVAEALLCGTRATVSEAQAATGLSSGSCTHALRVLTDLGLLRAQAERGRASGRDVVDRDLLLSTYASAAQALRSPTSLPVGVTWRDPVDGLTTVGNHWDKAELDWAATGAVASAVVAPFLANVPTAEVYVDADTIVGLEAVAADAGLRPIEGGRLTLRPFPTVAVRYLAEEIEGLRVAPWPRVYADLLSVGVRGEEAAEHLREVIHAR
jgi:hypothetical protein